MPGAAWDSGGRGRDELLRRPARNTYPLTSLIDFTTADSGRSGHFVTYQAYGTETPVVTGGRTVTGWTPTGNGQYKAPVGTLNFRQMYVDGARATRAPRSALLGHFIDHNGQSGCGIPASG